MRANRVEAGKVHFAKGNRNFSKSVFSFRALCSKERIIENSLNSASYSLDAITCKECLEAYISLKEKELMKAKEYLKFTERRNQ